MAESSLASSLSPLASSLSPLAVLRHDVDLRPDYSLRMARLEHSLGISATYYFRCLPCSWDEAVIREIVQLGHEVGYHYEDMSLCSGDVEQAIEHFRAQLNRLRQFYPVRTICMHGAPTSRYDGRDLWLHYDYHDMGILGEPYFDVDYSTCLYLTDTGRCWDGFHMSVRDRIPDHQDRWIAQGWTYHRTSQLISAISSHSLTTNLMLTTHPQRWTDARLPWYREMLLQSVKNIVKRFIVYGQTHLH